MKILILVNLQNDFVYQPLGNMMSDKIAQRTVEKLENLDSDTYVIVVRDTHPNAEEYATTREAEKQPIPHCEFGTMGWELQKGIERAIPEDKLLGEVYTPVTSAPDLISILQPNINHIESIELCGLFTDTAVAANAILLQSYFGHEVPIIVDSHCCTGTDFHKNNSALDVMRSCLIDIV